MSERLSTVNSVPKPQMVFLVVFILLHIAMGTQIYWLARDVVKGDGSCEQLSVPLRYPAMRVPTTPITVQHHAENRLCADFALIYFQSLESQSLRGMYELDTTVDLWGRPSRYPPLMHVVCAKTLCNLKYGHACLVHLGVQYALFIASFIFACLALQLRKYLLVGILMVNVSLFLTPVGLSFLERGQYTLYVGLCYLWLLLALVTGKYRYIVISALFGFLKWTSLPLVFVVFAIGILAADSVASLKKPLVMAGIYAMTLLGLLLLVPDYAVVFIKGLFFQELELVPMGNSLARILSKDIVKSLPFVLVAFGWCSHRVSRKPMPYMLPFLAAAATILVTYPTFAFDYSVPYLLPFVPFLCYWANLPGINQPLGMRVTGLFSAFLLLASFAHFLFDYSGTMVILAYVAAAAALIFFQLFTDCRWHRVHATS